MEPKIRVVGRTNEREVYVASLDRAFALDEYLMVHDREHNNPVGEIVETYAYAYMSGDTILSEIGIQDSLQHVFSYEEGTVVYIGKLKFLDEWQTPVVLHAEVSLPSPDELEKRLIGARPERGLTLGVIRGTEAIHEQLPEELKNIAPLMLKGLIAPQKGIPFILDHYMFREYPHIALYGGSGSGKTTALRTICEEIMTKRIPGIAFDPHNELSFGTKMDGLPSGFESDFTKKHEIFEVGADIGINFTELQTEELLTLLEFTKDLSEPMRSAVEQLHERNDSFVTLINRVNKLKTAFENMEKPSRDREDLSEDVAMLYAKHKDKIAGSKTLQGISWRLEQLQNFGIFSNGIAPVEKCLMNRRLAVVRGKPRPLRVMASYLLSKLYYKRREYKDFEQTNRSQRHNGDEPLKFPPFFVILDEAHRFAPNGEYSNPTKRILREISQEARKYGVFEVFGTQRPALLDTTITAMLNTKMIFRTSIKADMDMIEAETNLTASQVKRLPDLNSGNAFVSSPTLQKTLSVRFRVTKTVSPHADHPFDELDEYDSNSKLKEVLLSLMPVRTDKFPDIHPKVNEGVSRMVSIQEIEDVLVELAEEELVSVQRSPFGSRYEIV